MASTILHGTIVSSVHVASVIDVSDVDASNWSSRR